MKQKIVFIDTNVLLFPLKYKINITEAIRNELGWETKILVPDFVLNEIKKLSKNRERGKYAFAEKLALHIGIFETPYSNTDQVDDRLLDLCEEKKAFLLTLDKRLQQKAINRGIKVLQLKGKKSFKS